MKDTQKRFELVMSKELADGLKVIADKEELSVSALIRSILKRYIKDNT